MVNMNIFKVILVSVFCCGSFCGSLLRAANFQSPEPCFLVDQQASIKMLGAWLRISVSRGSLESIKSFFSTHSSNIPFMYACVQDADPESGYTAFTLAGIRCDVEALKALAEPFKGRTELLEIVMTYTKNFNTVLIMGAYGGRVEVVRAILELFKDDKKSLKEVVMQQHSGHDTALVRALPGGHFYVVDALLEAFLDDVESFSEVVMQEVGTEVRLNAICHAALLKQLICLDRLLKPLCRNRKHFKACLDICLSQARAVGDSVAIRYFTDLLGQIARCHPSESLEIYMGCSSCFKLPIGLSTLMTCSRCKPVRYCDEICQRAHWKAHKAFCEGASKEREYLACRAAGASAGSGGSASSH